MTGYDLVTGSGSPNGGNLVDALVSPDRCQRYPDSCLAIYKPWWWLKCPACGIDIFISPGDEFARVTVVDSLGREAGQFRRLGAPLVEDGVTYTYRATLKPGKGMGYVLVGERIPGREVKGRFAPACTVKSGKASIGR